MIAGTVHITQEHFSEPHFLVWLQFESGVCAYRDFRSHFRSLDDRFPYSMMNKWATRWELSTNQ